MAAEFNNLRLIESFAGNGNNCGFYGYGTLDAKATVETAGYFNVHKKILHIGDIIAVAGGLGGVPYHSSYVVSAVSPNVVLTEHSSVTQNAVQEIVFQKISTKAADAEVFRYVPSFPGVIANITTVLNAALATADATFSVAINGVAVTGGVVTAASAGSAAGDVDSAAPSANNAFDAGDVITVTVGGGSTATATANGTLQLTPT